MIIPSIKDFEKHSTTISLYAGMYECSCNKGLWAIYAPTKEEAKEQGFYYFIQYWDDGEYLPKEEKAKRLMEKLDNLN